MSRGELQVEVEIYFCRLRMRDFIYLGSAIRASFSMRCNVVLTDRWGKFYLLVGMERLLLFYLVHIVGEILLSKTLKITPLHLGSVSLTLTKLRKFLKSFVSS